MAKQSGGITGRVSGKLAGLVFGAARTATGKAVTIREKVNPSNPNTSAQQAQRSKFNVVKNWVQEIGVSIYQTDWNRTIQQLPGWQGLMRVGLNSLSDSLQFSSVNDIPKGNLHEPDTVTIETGSSAGEIDFSWSTENGANGTAADEIVGIAYAVDASTELVIQKSNGASTRTDGSTGFTLSNLGTGADCIVIFYIRGKGTALGNYTIFSFLEVTAGS